MIDVVERTDWQRRRDVISVDRADHLRGIEADAVVLGDVASCAVWWRAVPQQEGQRLGCIGQCAFDGPQAGAVLAAARAQLAARGCTRALLPMDGNTWRAYRFVVDGDGSPPFLLEPSNPPSWPELALADGFDVCERYISTVQTPTDADPRLERTERRLAAAGVRIRPVDHARLREDLLAVHRLSLQAFAGNVLYTPLAAVEFLAQYLPYGERMDPDFVLLAEDAQGVCGFVFALPDLLQAARGAAVDTLVVKTLAVRPGRAIAGLGTVLVERVQAAARARGLPRAIHALMHAANVSANIGAASVIRRYALFARDLP